MQPDHPPSGASRRIAAYLTLCLYSVHLFNCSPATSASQEAETRLGTSRRALQTIPFELRADTLLPTAAPGTVTPGITPFSADVTPNGSASVSIPLWVPPGRSGIQPSLAISYDSQGSDGLLGVGFNLIGLSQITLCPNTIARDGTPQAIDFETESGTAREDHYEETYCLDGERLAGRGPFYQTERDSYSRIQSFYGAAGLTAAFEYRGRDGLIRTYGSVLAGAVSERSDALLTGVVERPTPFNGTILKGKGPRVALAWALAAVEDRYGNRMDIFYEQAPADTTTGVWQRPARIVYTQRRDSSGLLEPGQREVTFTYENRSDTFTGYLAGVKVSRDFRLANISMKGPGLPSGANSLTQTLLRTYRLTYTEGDVSRRSLLAQFQECDGTGVCKGPVRFEWEKGSWAFTPLPTYNVGDAASGVGLNAFGLGAGRYGVAYFVKSEKTDETPVPFTDERTGNIVFSTWHLWKDTMRLLELPTTSAPSLVVSDVIGWSQWEPEFDIDHGDYCKKRQDQSLLPMVVDWDGFGRSSVAPLSCVWGASDEGYPVPYYYNWNKVTGSTFISGSEPNSQYWLDVDGDRRNDLVWMGRHEIDLESDGPGDPSERRVVVKPASGRETLPSPPGHFQSTLYGLRAVDLDGSGKMSLLGKATTDNAFLSRLTYRHVVEHTNPNRAVLKSYDTTVRPPEWSPFMPSLYARTFDFIDVNGDGLADALTLGDSGTDGSSPQLRIQLNTGNDFDEAVSTPFSGDALLRLLGAKTEHGDFDGDGRVDLAVFKRGSPVYVLLAGARGDFATWRELPFSSGDNLEWAHVVDINSDGLLDLTYREGNQLRVMLRAKETDVLKRVHGHTQLSNSDGLTGVNYAFEYAPLSNPNPYGIAAPPVPFYVRGYTETTNQPWLRTAPETMRLVSRMSLNSNSERLRSWRYAYRDGRSDTRGLGWLGFAERTVVDELTGAKTATTYGNSSIVTTETPRVLAPTAHLPLTETTSVPNGPNELLVTTRTWEYSRSLKKNFEGKTDSYRQYVKRETEVVNQLKSGVATPLSESEVLTDIDAFGTPTHQTMLLHGPDRTEQVTSTTSGIDFDTTEWLPRGQWTLSTTWMACPRAPGTGCVPATADAKNIQTRSITYDSHGQIASVEVEPSRAEEGVSPDTSEYHLKTIFDRNETTGLLERVTRQGGGINRFESVTYDELDQTFVSSVSDTKGATWRYLFHPGLGVLAQSADPNGVHVRYQYDGFGRQRVVTPFFQGDSVASGDLSIDRAFYEWESDGLPRIRATVDTGPGVSDESILRFDALGRPVSSQEARFDGQAVTSRTTYDARGRVLKREMPRTPSEMAVWEQYEYDGLDRIIARRFNDGTTTAPGRLLESFAYTVPGPYATETAATDATGRVKRTLSDFRGLMVKATEAAGTDKEASVRYSYGAFGRMEMTEDPKGNRSSISYDQAGRIEQSMDPSAGMRLFHYNAFGEVKYEADGPPEILERLVTTYQRDELGRVTAATNGKETLSYAYDEGTGGLRKLSRSTRTPSGRPDEAVTTAYAYDDFGRLTDTALQVAGNIFDVSQSYDRYGRTDKLTYPAGIAGQAMALSYDYDARGQLQRIGRANTSVTYWSALDYDSAGRLRKSRHGNGIEREQRYDSRGQLRFIESKTGGAKVQQLAYEYTEDGNLSARHDLLLGATEKFSYDALDRLERWTVLQKCPDLQVQFSYDITGNLLSRSALRGTESSALLNYQGGASGGPYAVKQATLGNASFTYDYDHRGNQTIVRDGNGSVLRTLQYTPFNLPEVITEGGASVRFAYDAAGTRVRNARDGGEEVLYIGGLYQRRTEGTTRTHVFTVPSPDGVVAELIWTEGTLKEDVRYFLNDLHGSPDAVTDGAGALVDRYKYDPFGVRRAPGDLTQSSGAAHTGSRRSFTGHEADDEFGLLNMRGRIYDPRLMRFLSVDPVVADAGSAQAHNAYSYVLNNPLRYTDPSGFTPIYDGGTLSMRLGDGYSTMSTSYSSIATSYYDHMMAPGATPFLPSVDFRVPSVAALDDARAQPAGHHTNDIGQSATPAVSSQASLLSTAASWGTTSLSFACKSGPCGAAMGIFDQLSGVKAAYDSYAPIDRKAGAIFALNEVVPFIWAADNSIRAHKTCAAGPSGTCAINAIRAAGYTLSAGASIYSAAAGAYGVASRGAVAMRGGLAGGLAIDLGPAGSATKIAGTPGAMVPQLTANTCGPACGAQLLRESGLEAYQSNLTSGFYKGLTPQTLAENLNKFQSGWKGFMAYPTKQELQGLARNGSFIARVGGNPGHFVIIDKISHGKVFIRDPIGGIYRTESLSTFIDTVSGVIFR